jgi:hypothetical protein
MTIQLNAKQSHSINSHQDASISALDVPNKTEMLSQQNEFSGKCTFQDSMKLFLQH